MQNTLIVCRANSYLDGTVVCDQLVLHVIIPKPELRQVLQQMLVHNL